MMHRSRRVPYFVALLAAFALLPLVGCKKDGGGSAAASSVIKQLPADSVAVGGVNLAGLTKEGFVRAQLDESLPSELKEFKDKCGIDVFTDIDQVLIGFKDETNMVVGAKVKFDAAKLESCVKEYGGTAEKDGDLTKVTMDGKPQYLKWSGKVLLMSDTKEALASAGSGDGVTGNKDVMKYVEKANTGATLWAAGLVPPAMKSEFPVGNPPDGFYLSVRATQDLEINAGAVFPEEADAEQLKQMADQSMEQFGSNPMLGQYIQKIKLEQAGAELKVDIKLSEEDLKQLQGLAGMFGGGF